MTLHFGVPAVIPYPVKYLENKILKKRYLHLCWWLITLFFDTFFLELHLCCCMKKFFLGGDLTNTRVCKTIPLWTLTEIQEWPECIYSFDICTTIKLYLESLPSHIIKWRLRAISEQETFQISQGVAHDCEVPSNDLWSDATLSPESLHLAAIAM